MILSLALVVISGSARLQAANADDPELIKLKAYDNVFFSGYTVVLHVSQPSQLTAKAGFTTSTMTLSGDGFRQALQSDALGVDPVKFSNSLHSITGRRDASGNFVAALPKSMSIYFDSEGGKLRTDQEVHIIPKDKAVAETKVDANTLIESFPPDHQDLLNRYYRYILPLGRGYSQLIDSVSKVALNPDGTETIKGRGKLFSRYPGDWSLHIDISNDYVVLDATFQQDGAKAYNFTMTGSDPFGADLKVNRAGAVKFGPYPVSVNVVDYQSKANQLLLNKANSKTNDASGFTDRSTTIDFHQLDGQGMPQVRRTEREVKKTAK